MNGGGRCAPVNDGIGQRPQAVVFNPVVQNTAFKQRIYSVQSPAVLQG
jgi:hypothetical protein